MQSPGTNVQDNMQINKNPHPFVRNEKKKQSKIFKKLSLNFEFWFLTNPRSVTSDRVSVLLAQDEVTVTWASVRAQISLDFFSSIIGF